MKTKNGFELSDFSVDIRSEEGLFKVRAECFATDDVHMPFVASVTNTVNFDSIVNADHFLSAVSMMVTRAVNDLITSDISNPDLCECQNPDWFKNHPDDRQEYCRTKSGRSYPKAHTVKCPNNPATGRKND